MALTRDDILNRKHGHDIFEVEGGTVTLRGLSRDEVLELQELPTAADKHNFSVHKGLIDPAMSLEDVAQWATIPGEAGEITRISDRVQVLSGLGEGAGKSRVARPRGKR